MTSATILGLDTPAGAYLARLLRARGYDVAGTAADPAAAAAMLATLGADEVRLRETPTRADEVYRLDTTPLEEAAAAAPAARLFVALAPHGDAGGLDALRAAGRFAAGGRLYDHASRLDPQDHWALATIVAVRDGTPLPGGDDAPRDLGWTPEYVDAMWRMLQADAPRDHVVATGVGLDTAAIVRHAAEYFRVAVSVLSPAAAPARLGDPAETARTLGWRAFTYGRDLVRTLCEGLVA